PEDVLLQMAGRLDAGEGDLMLFVADGEKIVHDVLSRMRLDLGKRLDLIKDEFNFVWIIDFPLLEWDEDEKRFVALHHPFTSPVDDDIPRLFASGGNERELTSSLTAKAYDIVLNG